MSSNDEFPYRFAVLPLKQLFVDEEYQRPLTSFVNRIEKRFNPALVGTLVVSERRKNTKFAVVDGQTRMVAMSRVGLTDAPCLIYEGLGKPEEAQLFSDLQTERRGMVAANRFRAQVVAKDKDAIAIEKAANDEGFTIGLDIQDGYEIQAIGALEQVYRGNKGRGTNWEPNVPLLRQVLRVLRETWPDMPEGAKAGYMIRGMVTFIQSKPDYDEVKLTSALGKVTPSELARRSEQLREGRGVTSRSPQFLAEAIASVYRRGR